MSVLIDNTEDLLTVLKKLDVKVHSVDQLHHLLTTINASYDPESARQKTARLVGMTVPGCMAGAATVTSCVIVAQGHEVTSASVVGLALAWGACALVSVAALMASAIMLGTRRGQVRVDNPPSRPAAYREQGSSGIVKELEI